MRLAPVITDNGVKFVSANSSKTSYMTDGSQILDFFDIPVSGITNSSIVPRTGAYVRDNSTFAGFYFSNASNTIVTSIKKPSNLTSFYIEDEAPHRLVYGDGLKILMIKLSLDTSRDPPVTRFESDTFLMGEYHTGFG
jgi:hypothetical protein